MTNLPQVSAPALAYALQWLEDRKDMVLFGVPALQPIAGENFLRQHFQLIAMSGAPWHDVGDRQCPRSANHRLTPPCANWQSN